MKTVSTLLFALLASPAFAAEGRPLLECQGKDKRYGAPVTVDVSALGEGRYLLSYEAGVRSFRSVVKAPQARYIPFTTGFSFHYDRVEGSTATETHFEAHGSRLGDGTGHIFHVSGMPAETEADLICKAYF